MKIPKSTLDCAHEICLAASKLIKRARRSHGQFSEDESWSMKVERGFRSRRLRSLSGFNDVRSAYPFELIHEKGNKREIKYNENRITKFNVMVDGFLKSLFAYNPTCCDDDEKFDDIILERLKKVALCFDFVLVQIEMNGKPSGNPPHFNWFVHELRKDLDKLEDYLFCAFKYYDSYVRLDECRLPILYQLVWAYRHLCFGHILSHLGIAYQPDYFDVARIVLKRFKNIVNQLEPDNMNSRTALKKVRTSRAIMIVDNHPDWSDARIARCIDADPSFLCRNDEYKAYAKKIRRTTRTTPPPKGEYDNRTERYEAIDPISQDN